MFYREYQRITSNTGLDKSRFCCWMTPPVSLFFPFLAVNVETTIYLCSVIHLLWVCRSGGLKTDCPSPNSSELSTPVEFLRKGCLIRAAIAHWALGITDAFNWEELQAHWKWLAPCRLFHLCQHCRTHPWVDKILLPAPCSSPKHYPLNLLLKTSC